MFHRTKAFTWAIIPLLIATGASAGPASGSEAPVATEQLAGTVLNITPQIAYESAVLRVSAPDGYSLTERFPAGTPIAVDLLAEAKPRFGRSQADESEPTRQAAPLLPDGRYRYELVLMDAASETHVHTGLFYAEGGALLSRDTKRAALAAVRADLEAADASSGEGGTQAYSTGEFVYVLDSVDDGTTVVTLDSDNPGGSQGLKWSVINQDGVFYIDDFGGAGVPDGTSTPELTIENGARSIFDADGRLGIGTTAPGDDLDVFDTGASTIRLADDSGDDFRIVANDSGAFLDILATGDGGTLTLERGAGVAISATLPFVEADFQVFDVDGNDSAAFRLTRGSSSWAAAHNANGRMVFNKIGTGGAEFTIRDRLDADGPTLFVQGSVEATQFISTSSREVKTAFEDLQPVDVLAKLAALPVSAWRYVWEDASARHVGPVAEDFQRLFGLGDGKTIGTVDADGVLMAAVQGLKQLLDETRAAIAAKDAKISELASEIASLRAAIDSSLAASTPERRSHQGPPEPSDSVVSGPSASSGVKYLRVSSEPRVRPRGFAGTAVAGGPQHDGR